jgi:hypothetical protein
MFIRFWRFVIVTLAAASLLFVTVAAARAGDCEPAWTPGLFPAPQLGLAAPVNALAQFDDGSGSGPALYVGGRFLTGGGVELNGIAKWTGSSWEALGTGMDASSAGVLTTVSDLIVFDDGSGSGPALYAGGDFITAGGVVVNGVAKWEGSSWAALGTGLDATGVGVVPSVNAMAVFDDGSGSGPALYVGGRFTSAGGLQASRIAKWDGASWSAVGGGMNGNVLALTVFDDGTGGPGLYAAGGFTDAGGMPANRIAKWDGSSWTAVGAGTNDSVSALTIFDDAGGGPALYAGGWFTSAGGMPANRIAKWDGASWSPLGSGMIGGAVYDLTVFDDGSGSGPALYAGGAFFGAGGVPASRVAKWDGAMWSPLGTGVSAGGELPFVNTLFAVDDDGGTPALYAGGGFISAGDAPSWFVARWAGCPSVQTPCPGDTNGDGVVNFADLNAVLASFGQSGASIPGDVNADGRVDFADLNLVLSNFGLPCPD